MTRHRDLRCDWSNGADCKLLQKLLGCRGCRWAIPDHLGRWPCCDHSNGPRTAADGRCSLREAGTYTGPGPIRLEQ